MIAAAALLVVGLILLGLGATPGVGEAGTLTRWRTNMILVLGGAWCIAHAAGPLHLLLGHHG